MYNHAQAVSDVRHSGKCAYVNHRCEPDEYTGSIEDAFAHELDRFSNEEQSQMTDAQEAELQATFVAAWAKAREDMQRSAA